ncbi:MAG: 4-hydroxy-3-methylbut-2-enyl diphosphate reductase [Prolixibacteraceae bacterium]
MLIQIDTHSGFCFGVQKAILKVEELVSKEDALNCLGEIVHNHEEVERLTQMGMKTVANSELTAFKGESVLIRTHGEPPSTYAALKSNNNTIIDATCPVVLKLQTRVKNSSISLEKENGQLVIFGKKGHAEVIGLNGQTGNTAIVISSLADLSEIEFDRPIELYSQTTMPLDQFYEISAEIKQRAKSKVLIHDTICRQVSNRVPHLKEFSTLFDVILFVSGKNSSNGKLLFEVCKNMNPQSYFVSSPDEIDITWFQNANSVGICGATSTPQWLMENVKQYLTTTLAS